MDLRNVGALPRQHMTSQTRIPRLMNHFRYFGRTPRAGALPIARPIPTQHRTKQKDADI
jgi:hypothetical protein